MVYPGEVKDIVCGNGATLTCAYQTMNIDYSIEDSDAYPQVRAAKNVYLAQVNDYESWIENLTENELDENYKEEQYRKDMEEAYRNYIVILYEAQLQQKKELGLL